MTDRVLHTPLELFTMCRAVALRKMAEARENGRRAAAAAAVTSKRRADRRARKLAPVIREIQASGIVSVYGLAKALNERGIKAARGGRWSPTTAKLLLQRLDGLAFVGEK